MRSPRPSVARFAALGSFTLRSVAFCAAFGLATLQPAAEADAEQAVLVELFTSQGCSSCPPADALLGELAERDDVVAVTLNVDYWDYLGWPDRLASPDYTRRQRAYQHALGAWTIYTPQMVVQGRTGVVGSVRDDVEEALEQNSAPLPVEVVLALEDGELVATVSDAGGGAPDGPASVWFFGYEASVAQAIGGGENNGREIVYHNVARDMRLLGTWPGGATEEFRVPLDAARDGVIVAVQEDAVAGVGAVIGLARLDLTH